MIQRTILTTLLARLKEPRRFIQVLTGPRQVGKTTLARYAAEKLKISHHYATADEVMPHDYMWLEQQWEAARLLAKTTPALLVLDEVQKIGHWSTVVKRLWDEDTHAKCPLQVLLLGSSPLLIQQGLTESLAGRFETIPIAHWSFVEMQKAFDWTVEQYIYFGGYPGAAQLINDEARWKHYINNSLIETTISKDILLLTPVNKPALLRRLFHLGCEYSGQILSYQKMLRQLNERGNTTTLAHYLELLSGAGMLMGLDKFAGQVVRQRGSSPKLQVLNTALMSAQQQYSLAEAQRDPEYWGRLVESAVGAHLVNSAVGTDIKVLYWREKSNEVDFVLQQGKKTIAIEVKSNRRKETFPGMDAFHKAFKSHKNLLVGGQGIAIEKFLRIPIAELFE